MLNSLEGCLTCDTSTKKKSFQSRKRNTGKECARTSLRIESVIWWLLVCKICKLGRWHTYYIPDSFSCRREKLSITSLLLRRFVFRKVEASDWWWAARDHGKGTDGSLARCLLPAFLCAHIFIKRETSGYEAEPYPIWFCIGTNVNIALDYFKRLGAYF